MTSPASLLARLEELKKWQHHQQERLMKEHAKKLQATERNFSSASDYETIDGLSEYDSPVKSLTNNASIEQTVPPVAVRSNVNARNSPPDDLEQNFDDNTEDGNAKPKRPFLKRGTGLGRYNMQPGDQNRPFVPLPIRKSKFHKFVLQEKQTMDKPEEAQQIKSNNPKHPLKINTDKQEVSKLRQNKKPVIKKKGILRPSLNQKTSPRKAFVTDFTDMTPLQVPALKIPLEPIWKARRSLNYNENVASPTPSVIKDAINCEIQKHAQHSNEECKTGTEIQCKDDIEDYSNENNKKINAFEKQNLFKQITEVALKTFGPVRATIPVQTTALIPTSTPMITTVNSNPQKTPGEQTMYERALEKDLMVFEQLEKRVLNSSFSSTNSSIIRMLASTPQKIDKVKMKHSQVIPEAEQMESKDTEIDDHDHDSSSDSSITSEHFSQHREDPKIDFKDDQTWSDSKSDSETPSEVLSVNSSFSTKADETLHVQMLRNVSVQTSPHTENVASPHVQSLIEEKLKQLDEEISSLRKQNAEVVNLRKSLDTQQRDAVKERKRFENEIEDQKMQMEFYLEDEKRKLAKERMVFERYTKDLQNKPNRKEREEISNLKSEVANLQETLKLKEAKNGNCQARLRTMIKSLEKENANLKEEVDKLNKLNAKLSANQKYSRPKSSDTKILHEINKNISKLAIEKTTDDKNKYEKAIPKVRVRNMSIGDHTDESDYESDSLKEQFERMKMNCEIVSKKDSKLKSKVHTMTDNTVKESERDEQLNDFFEKQAKLIADRQYQSTKSVTELAAKKASRSSIDLEQNNENDGNIPNRQFNLDKSASVNSFRTFSDIAQTYERTFGEFEAPQRISSGTFDESLKKDRTESILPDGRKEIKYSNGNVKLISPDGNNILMKYYNGDLKETKLLDGTIKYFYNETKTWHTTLADGNELFEFSSGQTERRYKDGKIEIKIPNGITRTINANKSEIVEYPDGMIVEINTSGEKTLHLPNGQKEIHTNEHKRREYPDGTTKILYPNGTSETRYANGRIRIKDKDGNLVMDSHQDS